MNESFLGNVTVLTTANRGFTPEEIADRTLDKIIAVGETSPSEIREQALAFKEYIRELLVAGMKDAVQSDRTTIANKLREAGHPELVEFLN